MKTIFTTLFCLFILNGLHAHGVLHDIISGGKGISVRYANGRPIKNGLVSVYEPRSHRVYLKGRTDNKGRFVFIPDKAGDWFITVNDRDGHGARIKISVNEKMKVSMYHHEHFNLWQKILIGISIILGISGLYAYYLIHKRKGDAHS